MAHNGGALQVNLMTLAYGRDFSFINVVKTMQAWDWHDNSNQVHPDLLDANGYPNAPSGHALWTAGGAYNICVIPLQSDRPGRYIVKWTGDGVAYMSGTVDSETITSSGGRRIFSITSEDNSSGVNRIFIGIQSRGASDYIRDLVVCHEDDEALYDAGEIFSPLFKQRLTEGGYGAIRFMDWQSTNNSTISQLSDLLPESYYSYTPNYARPDLYVSSTTNVGDDFSCAAPSGWGGLVDRATITVTFSASSTASAPTLNVGGSGAKVIKSDYADILRADYNNMISAGRTATLVFDALLDCWLKVGGNAAVPNVLGVTPSIPLSVIVRLCNEVGAHPWFCIPHYALDPFGSFTTDLATYVKNNLSPGLVPRFEPSNEQWNGQFSVYSYGVAREVARGQTGDAHEWYGRALAKMGAAISAVYANDRSKYQVVCGVQTTTADGTSGSDARLTSARYVSETGNAGDAAKFWTTHVACTGYWNPRAMGDATAETALADEYATATTARKAEILAEYVTDNTLFQTSWLGLSNADRYTNWKAWSVLHGVNGLCQYEGGWSPDYGAGGNRDALRAASKDCPELVWETHRNYQAHIDAGGEFPSVFTFSGQGIVWTVLDPSIYATSSPQWEAVTLWRAGKRRFKTTG